MLAVEVKVLRYVIPPLLSKYPEKCYKGTDKQNPRESMRKEDFGNGQNGRLN